MKLVILLTCIYAIILKKLISASAIHAPLELISYDDISEEDRKELDYLHEKFGRPKRSGSGSGSGSGYLLESLKVSIAQALKNKIGDLAKGSAVAASRLSSGSSGSSSGHYGHGYSYHHSPPHESHDHKSVDIWSLKKSVLNTLLQAVKAIKGGVIAVKGQLIKGGGYLTAATGKLIASQGDAVTNLGKKIISSAVLVPYHGHSSSGPSGHAEYGPPSAGHYSAPSAEDYHGAPSGPGPEYHEPEHHLSYHEDDDHYKGPSGLLVLKKIQQDDHHYHHHEPKDHDTPPFKPIAPSGPSFGTIVGKFLSASSSFDPNRPEPFGHTATGDIHSYPSHNHYEVSESKHHHEEVVPSASGYVTKDEPPPHSSKDEEHDEKHDSPFEKAPNYLAHGFDDEVPSSSKKKPHKHEVNSLPHSSEAIKDSAAKPQDLSLGQYDYPSLNVQNLGTAVDYNGVYNSQSLPNIGSYPNGFTSSETALMPSQTGEVPATLMGQNIFYDVQSSPIIDFTKNYQQPSFENSAENLINPSHFSNELNNYYAGEVPQGSALNPQLPKKQYPSSSVPHSHTSKKHLYSAPPSHVIQPRRPTRLAHDSSSSSSMYRPKTTRSKHSSSSSRKRPSTRITMTKHRPKQTYDVVKSVAYELGPKGPKRLT